MSPLPHENFLRTPLSRPTLDSSAMSKRNIVYYFPVLYKIGLGKEIAVQATRLRSENAEQFIVQKTK